MVNLFKQKGFRIAGILVAVAVLGFMITATLKLQDGNHDVLLRIRGRDGAVEVAQQVLDSLKSMGVASIPSSENSDTTFVVPNIERKWARLTGDSAAVTYTPQVTVEPTASRTAQNVSQFETIRHVYTKQVKVKVSWLFKGTTQSIEVSSVIR